MKWTDTKWNRVLVPEGFLSAKTCTIGKECGEKTIIKCVYYFIYTAIDFQWLFLGGLKLKHFCFV